METFPVAEADTRTYNVLEENADITIGGVTETLMGFVSRFAPTFHMPEGKTAPEPVETWFEVVEGEDAYVVAFYGVWENEKHPLPPVHAAYEKYREKRYKSARDIEHVTLRISKTNGTVDGLWYEDTLAPGFNFWGSPHLYTEILHGEDGRYTQNITPLKGHTGVSRPVDWDGKDLRFGIASWSRQFKLLHTEPEVKQERYLEQPQTMPLRYMTQEMYTTFGLAKRSNAKPGELASMPLRELQKRIPVYGDASPVPDSLLFVQNFLP